MPSRASVLSSKAWRSVLGKLHNIYSLLQDNVYLIHMCHWIHTTHHWLAAPCHGHTSFQHTLLLAHVQQLERPCLACDRCAAMRGLQNMFVSLHTIMHLPPLHLFAQSTTLAIPDSTLPCSLHLLYPSLHCTIAQLSGRGSCELKLAGTLVRCFSVWHSGDT